MKAARAVFLDRDGVLNQAPVKDGKPGSPRSVEQFHLLPGVSEACACLRAAGYVLVVVTNQPDVGRGLIDRAEVEQMHGMLEDQLAIDRVEVCYDAGDQPSAFRKPEPGMLLRAARELHLDLAGSFMVGDRWRDVDSGHAAGCNTIFVDRGYREPLRQKPDFIVRDLPEAARLILVLGEGFYGKHGASIDCGAESGTSRTGASSWS